MPRRVAAICLLFLANLAVAEPWQSLGPGLDLAVLDFPRPSAIGDSKLTVLRVDPQRCRLSLRTSAETGEAGLTARAWAKKHGLRAVTNAGMFRPDERPVGFLKTPSFTANPKLGRDRMLLLLGPVTPGLPEARLFDREFDGPLPLGRYGSALQGIRMVDARRRPRWSAQPKQWSTAALGIDSAGRLLLLHARSPYPVREFVDQGLALPIDLQRAMYLEGGPEASLYVDSGGVEVERFGSFETGFFESDGNTIAWPLPNVLAVESCAGPR